MCVSQLTTFTGMEEGRQAEIGQDDRFGAAVCLRQTAFFQLEKIGSNNRQTENSASLRSQFLVYWG